MPISPRTLRRLSRIFVLSAIATASGALLSSPARADFVDFDQSPIQQDTPGSQTNPFTSADSSEVEFAAFDGGEDLDPTNGSLIVADFDPSKGFNLASFAFTDDVSGAPDFGVLGIRFVNTPQTSLSLFFSAIPINTTPGGALPSLEGLFGNLGVLDINGDIVSGFLSSVALDDDGQINQLISIAPIDNDGNPVAFSQALFFIGQNANAIGFDSGSVSENAGELIDDVNFVAAPGNPAPVPEPGTMALMGVGLASLVAARRRKKNLL